MLDYIPFCFDLLKMLLLYGHWRWLILHVTARKAWGMVSEMYWATQPTGFTCNDAKCFHSPPLQHPSSDYKPSPSQHPAPHVRTVPADNLSSDYNKSHLPLWQGTQKPCGGMTPAAVPAWHQPWHHDGEGRDDRGRWRGQRAPNPIVLRDHAAHVPLRPQPYRMVCHTSKWPWGQQYEGTGFVNTHTLPREHLNHAVWCLMRTKTQETSVCCSVHAPIWHLADADPDLRAHTPQPLLPVPTKSAGNTPNATCTMHRESWSPRCGGKAASRPLVEKGCAVAAWGCTGGHGQHQLTQRRGSLWGQCRICAAVGADSWGWIWAGRRKRCHSCCHSLAERQIESQERGQQWPGAQLAGGGI